MPDGSEETIPRKKCPKSTGGHDLNRCHAVGDGDSAGRDACVTLREQVLCFLEKREKRGGDE
jgi:hypothetical protein